MDWKELHAHYQSQTWVDKPSLFAEAALPYFPEHGRLLELGAGIGQDSEYFASNGFNVTSSDLETHSLSSNLNAIDGKIQIRQIDLREPLPFENHSFDIVYAHLSLHYFDHKTTCEIFQEIERILKPGGILAFLANSTDDPEYNAGTLLEKDFFLIGTVSKRYLSIESARRFTNYFEIHLLDNLGQTYKDNALGIKILYASLGASLIAKPILQQFLVWALL